MIDTTIHSSSVIDLRRWSERRMRTCLQLRQRMKERRFERKREEENAGVTSARSLKRSADEKVAWFSTQEHEQN